QVFDERDLHIGPGGSICSGLVINLVTDNRRVVPVMIENLSNDSLGVEKISWTGYVHVLAETVSGPLAAESGDEDFGMLAIKPNRNRIGRRTHYHFDTGLIHALDDSVHPREFKMSFLRLPQPPARFAHSHDVDAGLFHHLNVLIEAFIRHVLVVIRDAVENCVHSRRLPESLKRIERSG